MIQKIIVLLAGLILGQQEVYSSCCAHKATEAKAEIEKTEKVIKSKSSAPAKKPALSERVEKLENRVEVVENKVDTLAMARQAEKKGEEDEE